MVGSKRPIPHRFHLSDGRVLEGKLHRSPTTRLADHLSTVKGYISVTEVHCASTGERYAYLALNQDHLLFIEELPSEPAGAVVGAASQPATRY
ncbi:MAG TPA: hypothetical protein VFX98_04320 [Longimicrobiaceae bacterium]|nr:hypothetical protein [Longimicrobiaceae bacterium]